MLELDGEWFTDSYLSKVPVIEYIEKQSSTVELQQWTANHLWASVVIAITYPVAVFCGKAYMRNREPWAVRRPLFLWNVGLAFFSVFGTLSSTPTLVQFVARKGFIHSTCKTLMFQSNSINMWGYFFAMSKVLELGDTFFLVVKKSKILFLHWFHHSTILIYAFYGFGSVSANCHWFGTMNYSVHSIMYLYFAARAIGWQVPMWMAQFITAIQIAQMFGGLAVNFAVLYAQLSGQECDVAHGFLYMGLFIYGYNAVLFIHFFCNKYVKKGIKI